MRRLSRPCGLRLLPAARAMAGRRAAGGQASSLGDAFAKVTKSDGEEDQKWEYVPDKPGPKANSSEDSSLAGILAAMERTGSAEGSADGTAGEVVTVEGGVARVVGMAAARMGETVRFGGPDSDSQGLIVGLEAKRTVVALATNTPVTPGAAAELVPSVLTFPAGPAIKGLALDPLGRILPLSSTAEPSAADAAALAAAPR